MVKRRRLSSLERMEIYTKTGGCCAYCGCDLRFEDMQVDHVVPLNGWSEKGSDTLDTGVVSKEEYEAALKTDNKKTYRWEQGDMYDFGDVCPVCGWDSGQEPCNLTECPNCGATMDTQTIL